MEFQESIDSCTGRRNTELILKKTLTLLRHENKIEGCSK